MKGDTSLQQRETLALNRAVARLQARVLAVVGAVLGGLGIFVMTAWLLIKGGYHVGKHLQLLSNYFIGYSVTWPGSVVGLMYGAIVGGLIGWSIGMLYNAVVDRLRR
jgi:hypothetical protein